MAEVPSLRWWGTFAILPESSTASKNLRGDKILLPQSALEQLLSSAASQDNPSATRLSYGQNGHHNAWSNGFGVRDQTQQLPNPLMFRLENPKNRNVVYAGIREFSAPEGTIGLSPFLVEMLGIEQEDTTWSPETVVAADDAQNRSFQLTVRAQQLPKGTYARLRPLEAGYNPDDWKPILERQLRDSFTTLTRGGVLSVRGPQGEAYKFLVDKLAPDEGGICVVDTDIEVDIEALDEEQARETLRQIMAKTRAGTDQGSSKGGDIDIWKSVQGQVVPGDYVDYTLPSWNRSQPLSIILSNIPDEYSLDIFVVPRSSRQRALPRDTTHVFGNFDEARGGTKSISIVPSNAELQGAESILISVRAYSGPEGQKGPATPVSYTLRAQVAMPNDGIATGASANDQVEHGPGDEQCKNCLQWVPGRTMVLHENFCRRNNVFCPGCQSVFKKGSPQWDAHWHCDHDDSYGDSTLSKTKHDAIFHGDYSCPSCEFKTNALPDLARHRTTVCPGKVILCRFCHLEVPQEGDPFNPSPEVMLSGMTAHELADGSRTTECHLCDKIIRLRDMEMHIKHHELDKVYRTKPPMCRNVNCGRTLRGVGPKGQIDSTKAPGNDLGLCSHCFGPLFVSMHDPEGKALRRRVERRYLGQLMTGCRKAHCTNEWCKTGRANAGLEPKGSSSQAALPLVKPLIAEVANQDAPMFFCVDEASQTQRKLAEMMSAEKVWDLEWCIAAAEAEKGRPDKMRDWLQAWAPKAFD